MLSAVPDTARFYIGKSFIYNSTPAEHYFHGNLDDIRIYNRLLDTCEFKVLFDGDTAKPAITVLGSVLFCSQSAGYQWYFNGNPIPGATGQYIPIGDEGEYMVVVPVLDGCYQRGAVFNFSNPAN